MAATGEGVNDRAHYTEQAAGQGLIGLALHRELGRLHGNGHFFMAPRTDLFVPAAALGDRPCRGSKEGEQPWRPGCTAPWWASAPLN